MPSHPHQTHTICKISITRGIEEGGGVDLGPGCPQQCNLVCTLSSWTVSLFAPVDPVFQIPWTGHDPVRNQNPPSLPCISTQFICVNLRTCHCQLDVRYACPACVPDPTMSAYISVYVSRTSMARPLSTPPPYTHPSTPSSHPPA